jgi:hypothetical protein
MPAKKGAPSGNKHGLGGRPKELTQEFIEKEADAFLEWMKLPDSIWYKDFCLERNLNPDLLAEWAKVNEKFAGVYRLAKHLQESRILKGGLFSTFNASIVKLVLANSHDWKTEKGETKVSGDSVNPLAFLLQQADGKSKDLVDE